MKKYLLFILILLLGSMYNISVAQTGWSEQTNPLGTSEEAMLGKIWFVNETEGWITCRMGGFLHTTNAGSEWIYVNPFPSDTIESFCDPALSMSWVGTTHGWNIATIGGNDNAHGATIYRTTNGGSNWDKIILSSEPDVMGIALQFTDINNGWAITFNFTNGQGAFFRTTDGGSNWTPQNGIGVFHFIDANNGWAYTGSDAMGENPPYTIHKTTNGGETWIEQFSDNSPGRYNAIRFSDLNNGWVVGEAGKVLKTTNGGVNWNFLAGSGINSDEPCKTVFSLGANHVWIPSKSSSVNQTPFIQYSPNGGSMWSTQMTPFGSTQGSNAIFSICFVNPELGWLTADLGRIAKYTGTTDVETNSNNTVEFSLSQNYPNPFNPSTVISYQLPNSGMVTLKVYNLLGNELAVLVNEFKSAGNYKVEFNASDYSSGIYFYKLQSGTYIETRKMILMK